MAETLNGKGMGWLPDYPDFRDHTRQHDEVTARRELAGEKDSVKDLLGEVGVSTDEPSSTPGRTDLRAWCSPIEDQGPIGSCTAQAGVGMVEYFERKAFSRYLDASRLFLYKVTRNLMRRRGDTGSFLRTTMHAMVLFGLPPEDYYPYDVTKFDKEPPAFCYAYGQSYQPIDYYRLDPPGTSPEDVLAAVKQNLGAELPSMFGFTVFRSIEQADQNDGRIPFPVGQERVVGGHAVVAVGYDDDLVIQNIDGGPETEGALLIRNSWGQGWGEEGYGWLPYRYVTEGLATDWWSLIKSEWVESERFGG
jgi:C1A family cysteine protease